jgi:hypothetical protein
VNASKAIVMCPNDSEGVKWELSLIDQVDDWLCVIYLANPELAREANVALFESLAPQGEARAVKRGQTPIAAFMDSKRGWRVLTAHRPSVEAYTIALNTALQARFGLEGVRLAKPA